MALHIRPISISEANCYVSQFHRHNTKTSGGKFAIACIDGDRMCGVAICSRPIARMLDDGITLEVSRVCTDGTRNANSKLYGACAKIAWDMGYKKLITYTLQNESGASLRACGWTEDGLYGGGTWDVPSRPRTTIVKNLFGEQQKYPTERKIRWHKQPI